MGKTAEAGSNGSGSTAVTGGGVQSVDRALAILEVLARAGEAGVTEIAAELGVHKSTAFRLVATLEAHRLVEQTTDRGRYRLGVGILRLAGATTARLDLVQEARSICRRLAADTGETVNVAVLSESSALYLDQVAGSSALQPHNWVGQHIPLHATSNGKVLLSGLDEAALDDLLGKLPTYTPHTITRRARLREELERVREQGYAVAVDELEIGLSAVAAPIRNAHGDVVASMSVSGPSFRLPQERVDEVVRRVTEAAAEVSHRLGWRQDQVTTASTPLTRQRPDSIL
jgi:DNA-binding IclR family transcriptional regulator